jgi:hypothetical protein
MRKDVEESACSIAILDPTGALIDLSLFEIDHIRIT